MVTLLKLDLQKQQHLKIFKDFYHNVFVGAFSNNDERETLDNFVNQFYNLKHSNDELAIYVALDNNNVIGGIIADIYYDIAVIEYIVVLPLYRNNKIGKILVLEVLNNKGINHVFLEVDDPNMAPLEDKQICETRVSVWNKLSAYKVNINYLQPPLEDEKAFVDILNLFVIQKTQNNTIPTSAVKRFALNFFTKSFACKQELKQIAINHILEQIKNSDTVSVDI